MPGQVEPACRGTCSDDSGILIIRMRALDYYLVNRLAFENPTTDPTPNSGVLVLKRPIFVIIP